MSADVDLRRLMKAEVITHQFFFYCAFNDIKMQNALSGDVVLCQPMSADVRRCRPMSADVDLRRLLKAEAISHRFLLYFAFNDIKMQNALSGNVIR